MHLAAGAIPRRLEKGLPDHIPSVEAPTACPANFDLGRIKMCVLHPGAAAFTVVRLGESKTWFFVASEYYAGQLARAD